MSQVDSFKIETYDQAVLPNRITCGGVASEVRAELARQGRAAAWLAKQTGVARATTYRWLNGSTSITVDSPAAISKALDVPAWEFLRRAEGNAAHAA